MAVIAVSNPKGGAGKSTSTLLLATYLAEQGGTVCVIDADPRQPLVRWKDQKKTKTTVEIVGKVMERNIVDMIEQHRKNFQFVFIDLEGTGSVMVSRSISRADFVIIPVQASPEDVWAAADAIALVKAEEQLLRFAAPNKSIPYRVLLNRTNAPGAPVGGIQRELLEEVGELDMPMFRTSIARREAFMAVFLEGRTLAEMSKAGVKAGNLESALQNMHEVAEELVSILEGKDQIAMEEARRVEVA